MSYNGGNRGDIDRGAAGAEGETRQSLHGPYAGKALAGALEVIHSHPSLIALYLIFSALVNMFIYNPERSLPALLAAVVLILLQIFLCAGIMGSIGQIFIRKEWRPVAIIECGKLYFGRFFVTGLIFVLFGVFLFLIAVIPLFIIIRLFGIATTKVVVGVLYSWFPLLICFASSSIIGENLRSKPAFDRSLQIVWANKTSSFRIWLIICLPSLLIGNAALYLFPLSWLVILIRSSIQGYLHLILMATSLYFILELKKRSSVASHTVRQTCRID